MKLASFLLASDDDNAAPRVGVVEGDNITDISDFVAGLQVVSASPSVHPIGMLRLIAAGASGLEQARAALRTAKPAAQHPLAQVRLLAPLPRPGKVVAIGRNYAEHAKEAGVATTETPRVIFKLPTSVVGPGATVRARLITKLDFEVELGVVMGRVAREVSAAQALDYVAGYCVLNDLSAREFQVDVSPAQTSFAKCMDGLCPTGPWIVTRDEIPDPQTLWLRTWVNDQLMQDSNTHEMIHGVREIVSYISRYITLEPGDLVATGTPAGVGLGRNPQVWLKPGDRVRMEIDRIGRLENLIG